MKQLFHFKKSNGFADRKVTATLGALKNLIGQSKTDEASSEEEDGEFWNSEDESNGSSLNKSVSKMVH